MFDFEKLQIGEVLRRQMDHPHTVSSIISLTDVKESIAEKVLVHQDGHVLSLLRIPSTVRKLRVRMRKPSAHCSYTVCSGTCTNTGTGVDESRSLFSPLRFQVLYEIYMSRNKIGHGNADDADTNSDILAQG